MPNNITEGGVVVLHAVDQATDVQRAVGVAENLQGSFPGIRVHIVVNGPALEGLADLEFAPRDGVQLGACAVGLRRRNIDAAGLPDGVEIVATAPEVIVREQLAGAAYLRL